MLTATNKIDIKRITTKAIPPSANCSVILSSAAVAEAEKAEVVEIKRRDARNFNIVNLQLFEERQNQAI
ncbi:hypothetical protein GCM10011613_14700 [Cellvibrio zantedeschiae]|uniref:Uncharacterized protein n=1 Tax=Cellvibrio zantedeschiae TaxID=1237077 RepID=A0ABQ3AZ13_9GAMM|nr:hypothetical protein GCM10011613_14700 [Cellvibrio zantedeschiae]